MTFINANEEEIQLIPYKIDADSRTWGASPGSSALTTYKTQVEKRFAIEEAEIMWRGPFAKVMGYLAAGLALFSALVWVIGWIVRGLLGIPRGMDKRPDLSPQTPAPAAEMDIMKSEKLKHYSVADELTKWAKLKEDGHITEEEFNAARTKLLKKS